MGLMKLMGFGHNPLSREDLVAMVARRSREHVMMIHGDLDHDHSRDRVETHVDLSEKRHGPEVARLKSDLIQGRADDLLDAIGRGSTFPVERVLAQPATSRNGDGFVVATTFDVSPKKALEEPSF